MYQCFMAELKVGGNCQEVRLASLAVTSLAEKDPSGRHRSRPLVWCLWCLFRPEIGAIYAEQLKELKKARSYKSPMLMRLSRMLLKT